jgi:hypothetical protein
MAFTYEESSNEGSEIPLQLATGGVGKRKTKSTAEKEQKWSFCSELQSMTAGLIGMFKFDMAKHLFSLVGIKKILQNIINQISSINSWSELINEVSLIQNIFYLDNDAISLNETFDIAKYLEDPTRVCDDGSKICEYFLADHSSSSLKDVIFTYIQAYIKNRNTSKTENLNQVKKHIENIFNDMLLNTTLKQYEVSSINDLCLNLARLDVCYTPSFLKCFEVSFKESYGDCKDYLTADIKPYEDVVTNIINPIIVEMAASNKHGFAKQVKKIDVKKMSEKLIRYYKDVFFGVRHAAIENREKCLLNIVCNESFFVEMADITIFLIFQIARNIATQLISAKYFGESIRIQFTHFFNAVLACSPHANILNMYQRNALYWMLCPKKAIDKTLKTFASETAEISQE